MSRRRTLVASLTALGLSACTRDHNVMAPDGTQAQSTAGLGWFMIITAAVITVVFLGLLAYGLVRGGRQAWWKPGDRFVIAGGIVLPMVVIATITVLSLNQLNTQASSGSLRIEVTGHQFWWEVRYPDLGFTTANEFQIPVGRPVELSLRSADVQHSFWVPDLAGKIDMYPGHTNRLVIDATHAGRYRGQCAEFCGLQHAQMIFWVTASEPGDFDAWARAQAAPAAEPGTDSARVGRDAFVSGTCATCHTIRGTPAHGTDGPDLTHLASRSTIGAGAIPQTRGGLGGWIANSQSIKPGNHMPPIPVSPQELQGLLDYLEGTK